MKRYKHKNGESVAEEATNDVYKLTSGPWTGYIPKFLVEDSNDWEQVSREILLITEDGVPVFEEKITLYAANAISWATSNMVRVPKPLQYTVDYGWKYFSTEAARLTYIMANKPTLTLTEIKATIALQGVLNYADVAKALTNKTIEKLKKNDSNL